MMPAPSEQEQDYKKKMRIHFWVDPKFQGPYVFSVIVMALVATLGVGALFYLFLSRANLLVIESIQTLIHERGEDALAHVHFLWHMLIRQKSIVAWTYAGVCAVIFVGTFVIGVALSHRIAGPIIAFRRHVGGLIRSADTCPLRLRATDEMQDVQAAYNQVLAKEKDAIEGFHRKRKSLINLCSQKHASSSTSLQDKRALQDIIKHLNSVSNDLFSKKTDIV